MNFWLTNCAVKRQTSEIGLDCEHMPNWTKEQYYEWSRNHIGHSGAHPVVEQPVVNDPLETAEGKASAAGKLRIRFVSRRQRLCDPDNLSVKWLLDCLRYCGAIEGDEPEKISLEVCQEKVGMKSDECTVITIKQEQGDEIPMKQWRAEEAIHSCVTDTAIAHRLKRGWYPNLKLRRVNKRVVFVTDNRPGQTPPATQGK